VKYRGIELNPKNCPRLDQDFMPLYLFNKAFLNTANMPLAIAVERNDGQIAVIDSFIHGTSDKMEADHFYIDRLVKTLLWQKGGFRIYICGDHEIYEYVAGSYSPKGSRAFDADIMAAVYEHPFEVIHLDYEYKPFEYNTSRLIGRNLDGYRIGFDAGGSDRKVSAVVNGEVVFSEEVVWLPKENSDPDYHYQGIVDALKTAASHMPQVDAIGISSAGIYINNRTMVASLFRKVPADLFDQKVKDIYIRASKELGDIPLVVCNDGDVTALAGAMSLEDDSVLGIAMGTSEAGGYINKDGKITDWLNELCFIPVDANPNAMIDEWSGDIGCGVNYFSQDGVIKLAPRADIDLSDAVTPAEKLKIVQKLMDCDDPRAIDVYLSIGCYLGHSLAYYASMYAIKHVLLLGRVMSGKGGDIILAESNRILTEEYPEVSLVASLPDEKFRRVGQSIAAASLPSILPKNL
jgi:predicted NBD/HSP70 family sugar kinase